MPSISGKRLHTFPYMLKVLLRAAQFAHLSRRIIERELSELYKDSSRLKDGDRTAYVDKAVPDVLIKLHRAGQPMFYDAMGVLDHFIYKYGVLCPICFASHGGGYGPKILDLFMSPQFLRMETERYYYSTICRSCYDSMCRFYKNKRIETREDCVTCLCWLLNNTTFRTRLKANGWRKLRFDPRAEIPVFGPLRALRPAQQLEGRAKGTPVVLPSPAKEKPSRGRPKIGMWDALEDQQKAK